MASVAHLILAHRSPASVSRLVGRISHADAKTFIHIDKKVSIAPFIERVGAIENTFFITKRTEVTWGTYSMVRATLEAFKEILSRKDEQYDFINLLSEADYPLKNAADVHAFLDNHVGKSFVEMQFNDSPWWVEAQQKIRKYHLADYPFRGKYFVENVINRILPARHIPLGMVFTGRSQWMTLSTAHIRHVLSVIHDHPRIARFFKHTWGPDEFFFQTILYNSVHKKELVNDNLRYIDWTAGNMSPKILSCDDLDQLKQSEKLYGRKFDSESDSEVLDAIDADLLTKK